MSWVSVEDFSYTYPGEEKPVLKNINLEFKKGDFIVITGVSGSGKSTLGKAMAGFLYHDEEPRISGSIIVNGFNMAELPLYDACERVAYVQQNPEDQFCTLSVKDEIAFALENACSPPDFIEEQITHALTSVNGLDLIDRLLHTLSGGEKQKVAIASLLVVEPDVIILDEPTSNLDPDSTYIVLSALNELLKSRSLTVVIIEHKLSQLIKFAAKIFTIEFGSVVPMKRYPDEQHLCPEIPGSNNRQFLLQNYRKTPSIEITELNLDLNSKQVLNNVNLKFYPGEFVAIMGPNGSGKSTLLLSMMKLYWPMHGSVKVYGQDLIHTKTSDLVHKIGFVFQNPDHQLFTNTVWDEATMVLRNLTLFTPQMNEIASMKLSENGLGNRSQDHPQRLSYGEKRRLNLIAVILHEPKILLIDEFLIGQDEGNAHKWMRWFQNYASNGNTIIAVNHSINLAQIYCDRLVFLDHGEVIINSPISNAIEKLELYGYKNYLPEFSGDYASV